MMKQYVTLFFFLTTCGSIHAQQEQMYTQFMFNKQAYNPAYVGSFVSPTLSVIYRNQWMGMNGAPDAQVLNYDQPWLNNRAGLGGSISRQKVGITTNTTFTFAYCYKGIKTKRGGTMAVGLQFSGRNMRQNWADPGIVPNDQFDPAIPTEPRAKFIPNFGAGVYYYAYKEKWFAGFGVPRLFKSNIDLSEFGNVISEEALHMNMMGGANIEVNEVLTVTPQALFRYAVGAPFDADVNVSVMLRKKFFGGLTYRVGGDTKGLGESVDVMAGIQATENLFLCLSYDIAMTRLRKFHNGSVEATARWWFTPPGDVSEIVPDRPF